MTYMTMTSANGEVKEEEGLGTATGSCGFRIISWQFSIESGTRVSVRLIESCHMVKRDLNY